MSLGPFDPLRFVFWLLGFLVVSEMLMLGALVGTCVYWSKEIISGSYKCDPDNRVGEMVTLLLSTIIALIGSKLTRSDQ